MAQAAQANDGGLLIDRIATNPDFFRDSKDQSSYNTNKVTPNDSAGTILYKGAKYNDEHMDHTPTTDSWNYLANAYNNGLPQAQDANLNRIPSIGPISAAAREAFVSPDFRTALIRHVAEHPDADKAIKAYDTIAELFNDLATKNKVSKLSLEGANTVISSINREGDTSAGKGYAYTY